MPEKISPRETYIQLCRHAAQLAHMEQTLEKLKPLIPAEEFQEGMALIRATSIMVQRLKRAAHFDRVKKDGIVAKTPMPS